MPRRKVTQLIPSMYHRRLLLLASGFALPVVVILLQLTNLTVVRADALHEQAMLRLQTLEYIPTVRGRILDREKRPLATDRPCYNIAFDYDVITGRWAAVEAYRQAVRDAGPDWSSMSRTEQRSRTAERLPTFQGRLEAMWTEVARLAGVSRQHLEEQKAEVIRHVQSLRASVTQRALTAEQRRLQSLAARGDEQAAQELTTLSWADVSRPVREERTHHTLLYAVPERVGLDFQRVEARDAGTPEHEDLLPGMRVINTKHRVYPNETITVTIDRSTFPSPLADDSPMDITVRGVATHIVGTMRDRAYAEDALERKLLLQHPLDKPAPRHDLGRYMPGDAAGHSGMERAAEHLLRGFRGTDITQRDTDEHTTIPPTPGSDVVLTIDAHLQARVQALFDPALGLAVAQAWHQSTTNTDPDDSQPSQIPIGTPLNGAAVVLDIDSADILALVSAPSFTREDLADRPGYVYSDEFRKTYLNRAINKAYVPGSVVKPLVLCASLTDKITETSERIPCTGHYFEYTQNSYRCWIYKSFNTTHSERFGRDLTGSDAVMCSCNIYFFELANRLAADRLTDWYTEFGVGQDAEPWNLANIPVHVKDPSRIDTSSLFADVEDARERERKQQQLADQLASIQPAFPEFQGRLSRIGESRPITHKEAILMGIGQGPIVWTPLHAADAYATIARFGVRITPRLRADVPPRTSSLELDPVSVQFALEGLRRSAAEYAGTTNHITIRPAQGDAYQEPIFNAPGITVRAKSGTADALPFFADLQPPQGQRDRYDGDHAWCVCLVGPENDRPRFAIAVVVDHAGSGGRVAGPIANQIIHQLIAEGYLPDLSHDTGT